MLRVADYIIERLVEVGISDIFMVTGRGILYLSDAVAKNSDIQGISVHHEQAGAYAATAYAQMNENAGACLVSTGCGATNALTGVLCAWQDSVPCIFISGQNMLEETVRYTGLPIRTYGSQEADILSMVQSVTKYAVMVTDANEIAYELDKALYLMKNGRKGPVWIDVPLDIQNARIEPSELKRYIPSTKETDTELKIKVQHLCAELSQAKRPVILIGNGVRLAGAIKELTEVVEKLEIPVVYAPSAADIYGSGNKLGIGTVGSLGGTREGNFTIQNADFIFSIGCSLASVLTGDQSARFAREAKIIAVDIDEIQHQKKNVTVDELIVSDAKDFLIEMLKCNLNKVNSDWVEKCIHWKQIFPLGKEIVDISEKVDLYYLAEKMSDFLPGNAVVVCDAGFEELIIPAAVHYKKGQRCIHPAAQGAMGYALPAAIGAYKAEGRPVIAVIGDGSIMMNLQELQTIVHHGLPIKVIIINNNVYSVIRRRQRDLFRNRTIGTDSGNGVSCPDFEKVASCFGLEYERIENCGQFEEKIQDVFDKNGAVICEIECVEEQRYLHTSIGKNSKNRIVKKPLEDLSPFLDREVFYQEMVIEPVDD